jgi:hypothetical protein
MASYSKSSITGLASDYSHLRTLPALLSLIFGVASFYLFGGTPELYLSWFDYTLTNQHALIASLAIFAVAFMSSETRDFDHYEDWEKVLIGVPPVLMLAHQYTNFVADAMANYDPWLAVLLWIASLVGWSVAVR